MTVRELARLLSTTDPELEVTIEGDTGGVARGDSIRGLEFCQRNTASHQVRRHPARNEPEPETPAGSTWEPVVRIVTR